MENFLPPVPLHRFFKKKSGPFLVIIILAFGLLGSWLTFWNYSQHVFSSNHAHLINETGLVEAIFPEKLLMRIRPHQHARITIGKLFFHAEVLSVDVIDKRTTVKLRLIGENFPYQQASLPQSCGVTIDTTIPTYEK